MSAHAYYQTDLARRLAPPPEPQVWNRYRRPLEIATFVLWGAFIVIAGPTSVALGGEVCSTLIIIGLIVFTQGAAVAKCKEEHPIWERMMEVWGRAMYCARCDAVYDLSEEDEETSA